MSYYKWVEQKVRRVAATINEGKRKAVETGDDSGGFKKEGEEGQG